MDLGQIPFSCSFPFIYYTIFKSLDGETRYVVHYDCGAMVDITTNGEFNNTPSLQVGDIFAIMAELMSAQRHHGKDDAANADAA
jgi:hypothetical protein